MARTGEIRLDISDAILAETMRVLRERFAWDPYRLHDAAKRIGRITSRKTHPIIASWNAPLKPDHSTSSPGTKTSFDFGSTRGSGL